MRSTRTPTFRLLATLALLLAPASALAQGDEAIVDVVMQWQERYNAGDPEGIAELYTDDLRWIVTSGITHTNHDGVVAQVRGLMDAGFDAIVIVVEDVLVMGDMAATMGAWVFTGPGVPDYAGHFTSTLVREDGVWRTARHASFVIPPPLEP